MLRDGKTHVDGHEERLVVLKLRRSIAALWAKKNWDHGSDKIYHDDIHGFTLVNNQCKFCLLSSESRK